MKEARWQRLLEDFQDGALSEAECRELMEWFDEDAANLPAFVEELRTGNTLAALHMMRSDGISKTVKDSLERQDVSVDISQSVRQRIESATPRLAAEVGRTPLPRRKRTLRWIGMTGVAAVVVAFVWLLVPRGTDHGRVVATVQNVRQVPGISSGDALHSRQVLKFDRGRIKVNFQSGARLAIQGPAEFQLLGPNSAQLRYGVATVRVPGEIKGFVLETPYQRVTDLGTSFGVDVDRAGDTAISVFEGEIELDGQRRLIGGQTVALTAAAEAPRAIPYAMDQFLDTWRVSFGVEQLVGNVRVASPTERHSPGLVEDHDSLLLFPEREDVLLKQGDVVNGTDPGTYRRPFRKQTVTLSEDVRVDSFLLQYNPGHDESVSVKQEFQGELHFDRPIVALILQKDLLDASDAQLALPGTNFRDIFRRGINDADMVGLSLDRRVLRVAFNVTNGVDQIRVLVATDDNLTSQ